MPDSVVITGEYCVTACVLVIAAFAFILLMKRLKLTKLTAAQQDAGRKPPPKDTEPADVPDVTIVPGMDGQDHIRAVGE